MKFSSSSFFDSKPSVLSFASTRTLKSFSHRTFLTNEPFFALVPAVLNGILVKFCERGQLLFRLILFVGFLLGAGNATAETVTLSWSPNLEPDIAGYRVYYGLSGANPTRIDVGNSVTTEVSNLEPGQTYVFAVTAYNTAGLESDPSLPVTYTVPSLQTPPTITSAPASQSVAPGNPVTFSVSAVGTQPFTYQWFKNDGAITGATSSSFTIGSVQASDAGAYSVQVKNPVGSATSDYAVLLVPAPLVITAQPLNQTVILGATANFGVSVTGSSPIQFQWFKNGSPISGATSRNLTIDAAGTADIGLYHVTVTAPSGSVTSSKALLSVVLPPVISSSPANQSVPAGSPATFSVVASGTEPFTYVWFRNGSVIPGAVGSRLVIDSAQTTDIGSYYVVITNPAGSARSANAVLSVILPPVITSHPIKQTAPAGHSASFSVVASGTEPFVYEWFRDGQKISGADGPYLSIPLVDEAHVGSYHVTIKNPAGFAASSAAELRFISASGKPRIEGATGTVSGSGGAPSGQIQIDEVGGVTIRSFGTPGTTYTIQACSDPSLQNWVTIGTGVAAQDGTYSVRDQNPAWHGIRVYRVLIN